MIVEKTKFETITEAQERCLIKRLEKNIPLKKLNLWFESLETTFKNNSDILDFIKILKLKGKSHFINKSKFFVDINNNTFQIRERKGGTITLANEHCGNYRIEQLDSIIVELLNECDYISITNGVNVTKIIEKGSV